MCVCGVRVCVVCVSVCVCVWCACVCVVCACVCVRAIWKKQGITGHVCVRMLQDHPINAPQSRVYGRRYMTSATNNVINASKFTLAALRNKETEVL